MMPAFFPHLWQSTIFAGVAALLTIALRGNRARVRFNIWLCASIKFVMPLSLLISVGSHIRWTPVQQYATPAVSYAVKSIAQPFAPATYIVPVRSETDWTPFILAGIWGCGFLAIAMIRLRLWLRVRATVRASRPLAIPSPVEIRSAPGLIEPGVVGWLRPVLLLPEGIVDRLTPAELEALLAHELCHIRRRDNLFAAIHMVIEALFWFHPLVWWIGARMVEERERACDEEVLNGGNQPRVYADAIVSVCRLYAESPLACMAGVTGSNIRKRIEAIMRNRKATALTGGRKALLASAGIGAVVLPIVAGILMTAGRVPLIYAQSPVPSFDVISVKQSAPDVQVKTNFPLGPGDVYVRNGGRFSAQGFPLGTYLYFAFKVLGNDNAAVAAQLPNWALSERFDIEARTDGDPKKDTKDQMRLMMRSLLAERFHLKTHYETRDAPIFAITLAKPGKMGPQLQQHPADAVCNTVLSSGGPAASPSNTVGGYPEQCGGLLPMPSSAPGRLRFGARNVTMGFIGNQLTALGVLGRPAVDQTGLGGTFDFALEFVPEVGAGQPGAGADFQPDPNGPTFSQGLREQLGLKLESTKGASQFLVIDHLEHPTGN
jgi:uncharacterized protein (TIGR03435 family)